MSKGIESRPIWQEQRAQILGYVKERRLGSDCRDLIAGRHWGATKELGIGNKYMLLEEDYFEYNCNYREHRANGLTTL